MGLQWDVYQYQLVPDFLEFVSEPELSRTVNYHWNCERTGKQGWKIHHLYMIPLKPPWLVRRFPIAIFGVAGYLLARNFFGAAGLHLAKTTLSLNFQSQRIEPIPQHQLSVGDTRADQKSSVHSCNVFSHDNCTKMDGEHDSRNESLRATCISLSLYQSIHPSIHSSIHPSIYQSINLSIYPSIHLSTYIYILDVQYIPLSGNLRLGIATSVTATKIWQLVKWGLLAVAKENMAARLTSEFQSLGYLT